MLKHVPGKTVILFAEAKERIRQLVSAMLVQHGYTVLTSPDGEAALELCRKTPGEIHMLLTNIVMPGINGFELADAVRKMRPGIKAVVISSHMDAQILTENPEAVKGVTVVFEDEFLPLNLLTMLEDVLDKEPTVTSAV